MKTVQDLVDSHKLQIVVRKSTSQYSELMQVVYIYNIRNEIVNVTLFGTAIISTYAGCNIGSSGKAWRLSSCSP